MVASDPGQPPGQSQAVAGGAGLTAQGPSRTVPRRVPERVCRRCRQRLLLHGLEQRNKSLFVYEKSSPRLTRGWCRSWEGRGARVQPRPRPAGASPLERETQSHGDRLGLEEETALYTSPDSSQLLLHNISSVFENNCVCAVNNWYLRASGDEFLFKREKRGFPGGAVVENLPAKAGDTGSSPGLGRSHMPRSN